MSVTTFKIFIREGLLWFYVLVLVPYEYGELQRDSFGLSDPIWRWFEGKR